MKLYKNFPKTKKSTKNVENYQNLEFLLPVT